MSSIQERLQLKRVPLDTWNIREQLCLASAVMRSGDQNWMSVSRALKTIGDPNRPADWYSQKSCAAQYGVLLENVETPKRKKRASEGAVETPQESILKKLTQERMTEIQNTLAELNQQYSVVKNEVAELRDPQTSEDRIKEIWAGIEASKRLREKEQAKRAAWLKEREERRLRAEKSWRPSPPISTSPLITSNPVVQQSQPSSPLLSSLLKSSPVVTTPQHIPHPANVVETISPSAGAPTLSMLLDKRPSTHDNEHAAIEHIKSEIVQLERQLKVAASNSPPPQVTMPSAVTIPTHPSTVPHAVDKIDLDDIEIKAEDVYAFSDIDLEIPPVSSIHKPIREEPKIVVPIEEDSKKEEDVDVDTIPADEPAAPPVVIPTTVPETVEIPPPPPPAPVVEVVKPDELEVCVTDEDDSILPQESESKSAEPNTVEEDIQQCVAKVDDAYMMNDTPGLPHVEEETQETESATQGASQEQNVQVEEKIVEQDNSEPSNTETEPQPQTETEPQTETTEAITTETTSTSEVSNETVSEVKAEENIMETEEPMIVENPKECEKPIEEINPVVEEVEESFVAVVEEVTKQEPIDEEKPIEEIKEESKKEAESIPPLVSEDSSKHEDTHTETDDDVPMELIREEEKDGKKKRDYSRKRKYDSRACSGSESAPDSPASSEADRQHKMWKKAVMVVHNRLCAHKCASLFLRPITNDQAPNYDKIVKKPMDLSSIKKNIDAGIIRTTSEFRRCVLLMLSNALFYNSVTHDVHRMTKEMHKEADAQLGMLVQAQAHAELPLAPRTHTHKRRSHTHTPKRPRIE